LGEALLNQVLASSRYTQVYVSTTAALPGSIAHLSGVPADQTFVLQDDAGTVDFFLNYEYGESDALGHSPNTSGRQLVYAPLVIDAVPALLKQLSDACVQAPQLPVLQYCLSSTAVSVDDGALCVGSYVQGRFGLVYGTPASNQHRQRSSAYQFKPAANSLLDRLGVWVLNVLSNVVHGMLNPQSQAPLTATKIAQRLFARFEQGGQGVLTLTAAELSPQQAKV
jgi:hypothetical protein